MTVPVFQFSSDPKCIFWSKFRKKFLTFCLYQPNFWAQANSYQFVSYFTSYSTIMNIFNRKTKSLLSFSSSSGFQTIYDKYISFQFSCQTFASPQRDFQFFLLALTAPRRVLSSFFEAVLVAKAAELMLSVSTNFFSSENLNNNICRYLRLKYRWMIESMYITIGT